MSFFDEGDEPTRSASRRPRSRGGGGGGARAARTATAGASAGASAGAGAGAGGARGPDRQTLLIRRGVVLGALVLALILALFLINSCVDNRREQSLKDFNADVAEIVAASDRDVGRKFFELMANGAGQDGDLQVQVNQLRQQADDDAERARSLDTPDAMGAAQSDLELVLDLRAGALRKVADALPAALGRGRASEEAIDDIAGQMQAFLSSDVIYDVRVAPLIKEALDDEGVTGQRIADSRFLTSLAWLSPATVADGLGRTAQGDQADVAPGLHGHGIISVSAGDTALQPSPTVNRVPGGAGVTFTVTVANQGDNDERDVRVSVRVSGRGRPIEVRKAVGQTRAGTQTEVAIPLGQAPPTGGAVTVTATVARVPGETNVENNTQTYTVIFTS